jgi:hypothetical protein
VFEYEEEIERFAETLEGFIERYELPDKWFKAPDHLAVKCADGLDYVYRMEELMPDAVQASEIVMDNRRLATLQLITPVVVGGLGEISWLEVMEPRPEKVGKDLVGLEHMEFYYPDFDEVTALLAKYDIEFTLQQNPGHAWVNIVLNEQGQELKLNDRLLSETVAEELDNGTAHLF